MSASEQLESVPDDEENARPRNSRLGKDAVGLYLDGIGKIPLLTAEQEVELSKEIEVGLFAKMVWQARHSGDSVKIIDSETNDTTEDRHAGITDDELTQLVENGQAAMSKFMAANTRLVVSIAKRYKDKGLSFDDLIQEGNVGLGHAIEKFDFAKGFKFSTYGTWWIEQALNRAIAKTSRNIRIPELKVARINKIIAITNRYLNYHGRAPTTQELAEQLDVTVDTIKELQRLTGDTIAYDANIGDSETRVLDLIVDDTDHAAHTTTALLHQQLHTELRLILPNSRQLDILMRRFGMVTGRPQKLAEIAEVHGITGERVRQIEAKAITIVRAHAKDSQVFRELSAALLGNVAMPQDT